MFRLWSFLAGLLLFPTALLSQGASITGTVRSPTLTPVPGARVALPNLEIATVTNEAGQYRLTVTPEQTYGQQEMVRVSAAGYAPAEAPVLLSPGRVRVDVTLRGHAIMLDELVVTGTAGTQARRAQPAVITTLDAASLVHTAPVSHIPDLLQSRVPGFSMTPSSGSSGQAQRIRLRGAASIALGNEPLFFVDGVRADSRIQKNNANGGQATSRLLDLNPDDIERIEVIKGPAAATLYGAEASTGVVQIFTKHGRIGSGRFSQSIALEYNRIDPNWIPPSNFARCRAMDIVPESPNPLCRGQAEGTIVEDNPLLREGVLRDGHLRSINWSARGGGSNYGYYVSLGMDDEEGTLPSNGFERRSGRMNFEFLPHPHLQFDAGLGVVRSVTEMPQSNDNPAGFLTALLGSPLTVGRANNGWFAPNRNGEAIAAISQPTTLLRTTPSLRIRHTPRSWFTQRLILGGDVSHSEGRLFFPKNDQGWYGPYFDRGMIGEDRQHHEIYTLDYLANTSARFGPGGGWAVDLSAGLQLIAKRDDYIEAFGRGLVANSARTVGSASERTGHQHVWEERAVGWLGQWQLAYQNRAFLQVGARIDRNSSFGQDASAFFLPKVGISYVLSEEPFWKIRFPQISTLRLRAAYGTTGRSPPAGSALQTYRPAAYLLNSGRVGQGVSPASEGNPELRPERGAEFEAGFDAALFGDRLGVELTAFQKVTTDLLLRRPLPPSNGFPGDPFTNVGEVRNRGVELAIQSRLLTLPGFEWDARLGASTLRNELVDMGGIEPFGRMFRFVEGRPLGAFYSRRIRSIDVENNRAVVSDTAEFVGSSFPSFEGSLTTGVSLFGTVRIHGLIDWKSGHRLHNATFDFRERAYTSGERRVKMDQLPPRERLRLYGPFVSESGKPVNALEVSEPYMDEADFIRWRELAFTWTLPHDVARRLAASRASLTLGARNLGLWTRYTGGDPEVVSFVSEQSFSEHDIMTMPQPRRWVARLSFDF